MNKKAQHTRASHDEIFDRLYRLLGPEATQTAQQVATLGIDGKNEQALDVLKAYDQKLGGVGVHWFEDKRILGVYRSFYYVILPFRTSMAPQEYSRQIVYSACIFLEELIKRMVRLNVFETLLDGKAAGMPLGRLAPKLQHRIPSLLYDHLNWLAQDVYNFAKHQFNFEEDKYQPDHYFDLDEAIAIYLISRKLGLELETFIGKSYEQLTQE